MKQRPLSFWEGLLAGRSHLAFLGGLGLALAIALAVSRAMPDDARQQRAEAQRGELMDLASYFDLKDPAPARATGRPLSPAQAAAAKAAWSYFERNTRPGGLVDSVEGFPASTLWDLGSSLMGMIAAERLGLIDREALLRRSGELVDALAKAPLLAAGLPNKSYDTRSAQMTDYGGTAAPRGIGWSAIDIARFAVPLTILAWREPSLTPRIRALLSRWDLPKLTADGELVTGSIAADGTLSTAQEGRLGYEQYAAASLALLGLDASRARLFRRHIAAVTASGLRTPADDRLPEKHGNTSNGVTSEPFLLLAAEHGLDADWAPIAQALLRAQERRALETGKLTAVSEDHVDRPPRFVYFNATEGGSAWVARAPDGSDASALRALSTKAALGWGLLFESPYADRLQAAALELVDPARGFWSGRYEADGQPNRAVTANTNGIALELFAVQAHGPWLRAARREVQR